MLRNYQKVDERGRLLGVNKNFRPKRLWRGPCKFTKMAGNQGSHFGAEGGKNSNKRYSTPYRVSVSGRTQGICPQSPRKSLQNPPSGGDYPGGTWYLGGYIWWILGWAAHPSMYQSIAWLNFLWSSICLRLISLLYFVFWSPGNLVFKFYFGIYLGCVCVFLLYQGLRGNFDHHLPSRKCIDYSRVKIWVHTLELAKFWDFLDLWAYIKTPKPYFGDWK